MTPPNVESSYRRCCADASFLARFRLALRAADGQVSGIFDPLSARQQEVMLDASIRAALDFSSGDPQGASRVSEMIHVHGRQGRVPVPPALYPVWLESLIQAVRETDPHWSDALERRWRAQLMPAVDMFVELYLSA
ncbi:hypothetical protein TVD_07385 [Thioalkalivibrio versutus]|uniref:Globin n=1 Tax=Thioalkalivibrio versutus TaxID=106634 RepID=A0A0G3G1X4_9GAMM|nr:hypothetical protein TVD_07385 [Thioalkalivibrio versutus]